MTVFKCKMCGGDISFKPSELVGTCEFCGTKQTLPRLDSDEKKNLYDRANHFRRNNEYDKAISIYEQILRKDTTDSEAYWSLVLCNYGIEYVEDPSSHKRIPTVNRAQFTSIFDDENYKAALKYSDALQKSIYEEEANTINEIQKGILSISQQEEPFDVFICYKETDANGRRTLDSVLAYDIYNQLIQEGLKVFFARVTLEDKLGIAYEPYIFAALNSAKVMIVLGTKKEYFEAVWVKNEWSRYLTLVRKSQGKKVLVPAFKDMNPYDLPEEFSHLQAQDMSRLGFLQDLIRGIRKIIPNNETEDIAKKKESSIIHNDIAPLLKRTFLFLEDGDWGRADDFCEQILNKDPENAMAYVGKLMAELKVKNMSALADCEKSFKNNNNFRKAIIFGEDSLIKELNGYIDIINKRVEDKRKSDIYDNALVKKSLAKDEESFYEAAALFSSISGFKDSDSLSGECKEQAKVLRQKAIDKRSDKIISILHSYNEYMEIQEKINTYTSQRKILVDELNTTVWLFRSDKKQLKQLAILNMETAILDEYEKRAEILKKYPNIEKTKKEIMIELKNNTDLLDAVIYKDSSFAELKNL